MELGIGHDLREVEAGPRATGWIEKGSHCVWVSITFKGVVEGAVVVGGAIYYQGMPSSSDCTHHQCRQIH